MADTLENSTYSRDEIDPTIKWVYGPDHPLYCHGSKSFVERMIEYRDKQMANPPPVNQENRRSRRARERREQRTNKK